MLVTGILTVIKRLKFPVIKTELFIVKVAQDIITEIIELLNA